MRTPSVGTQSSAEDGPSIEITEHSEQNIGRIVQDMGSFN